MRDRATHVWRLLESGREFKRWSHPGRSTEVAAVLWILQCIYEQDFAGFSYGFRRGRNCHQALDALSVGLTSRKVNWILDADIEAFFDTIDREWLIKFLERRIGDRRILRLIRKWPFPQ